MTIYTALEGGTQDSPCVANPVNLGLIPGVTLTNNYYVVAVSLQGQDLASSLTRESHCTMQSRHVTF